MKKVLVIQTQMKQYRAPLWERLHGLLRADEIQLTVAYSDPPQTELRKNDNCELPMEYGLKVKALQLWPVELLYQPLLRLALAADVVIVEQTNRSLLNHLLLLIARAGLLRVAFWGQGKNFKADQIRFSEWFRRKTINWASWWFAYTNETARYLETHGFPSSKITVVQNSVDTREICKHVKAFTPQNRISLRLRLGIPMAAPIGIFCGMLDKAKGLPFLIESSRVIKARIPTFHLIIVGGGPEQKTVLRLIEGLGWVHWVGPRFGTEKAECLAISDVFLLPCKVGLAILDAFAAGLPLLTTRFEFHAPEVEYLEHDINGLIAAPNPEAFGQAVSSLLSDRDRLDRLCAGASATADKYSIENMAENFRNGIKSCLRSSESGARIWRFQKVN
jgi:glycosyltransferase involved in cell wall biosynthesis